jgi:hypothetical protein
MPAIKIDQVTFAKKDTYNSVLPNELSIIATSDNKLKYIDSLNNSHELMSNTSVAPLTGSLQYQINALSDSNTDSTSITEDTMTNTILELNRIGSMPDVASTLLIGSGTTDFSPTTSSTVLTVGGKSKLPGRIYIENRSFMNTDQTQYLNGVNTPWNVWNEFGSISNTYDHDWWDAEFARLVNRGINATRVWINDSPGNEGVTLNSDGSCNPPTAKFWQDVDDLMALAATHKIFVMPTVMSFDHFSWNNTGSERYHFMMGKESNVQSFIDNFLVPLAERYIDNPWVWSIDLGNEIDGMPENMETSTPRTVTATPVGGGSKVVNFSDRLSDYVVGTRLWVNGTDMGLVTIRNSDTQCTATNAYSGASQTFGLYGWGFYGMNWATLQRYAAMASKSIHSLDISPLVTIGMQSIKYVSGNYSGDYFSDTILLGYTNSPKSKLDYHQIHWYNWAEPWYRLMLSPTAHGLSVKPAVMGEFPAAWANMNVPGVYTWYPQTYFSLGQYVYGKDDGLLYVCSQAGLSGPVNGVAGGDRGPGGGGNGITDGSAKWDHCVNDSTWKSETSYSVYNMIIGDQGTKTYICTEAGTSAANSSGPYGTTPPVDGTVTWEFVRNVVKNEKVVLDFFISSGWAGAMPWNSNMFSTNGGLYEVNLQNKIFDNWGALTDYYVNSEILNDGYKVYRCLAQGKSAASGGPTGTGQSISDGGVTWSYTREISGNPAWTTFGLAIKETSDENVVSIYPNTNITPDNSGKSIRQTMSRAWYKSGFDMQSAQVFKFDKPLDSTIQNVGFFDDDDGYFLSYNNGDLQIGVRSNGSSLLVDRSNWNIDKFDGSGPSTLTLDITGTMNTVLINSGWIHGGKNLVGFIFNNKKYWAHEFEHSSIYPSNPNLPLRWEIEATAPIDETRAIESFMGYVTTQNNYNITQKRTNGRADYAIQLNGGITQEAISIRIPSTYQKYSTLRPIRIKVLDTTGSEFQVFHWKLILNPYETGTGAWIQSSNGISEYNLTRSTEQGTGIVITQGYNRGDCDVVLENLPYLGATIDGTSDVYSLQITNLTQSSTYYFVSMDWEEIK